MRAVIAEDSVLLREGLARVLTESGIEVVAQVDDAEALMAAVESHSPEVAITDIRMPPTQTDEGLRAAEEIKDRFPGMGVLVLSQYVEPRYAAKLMDAGAGVGYLLKDRVAHVDELVEAVHRVASGGTVIDPEVVGLLMQKPRVESPIDRLSPRERELLGLMAQGHSNSSISEKLFLSAKTVETHITNIFSKLDLPPSPTEHRRVMAVLACLRA